MTRDWLDEQMDEADYWQARREAQRDIIEAELPDQEEDDDDDN